MEVSRGYWLDSKFPGHIPLESASRVRLPSFTYLPPSPLRPRVLAD